MDTLASNIATRHHRNKPPVQVKPGIQSRFQYVPRPLSKNASHPEHPSRRFLSLKNLGRIYESDSSRLDAALECLGQ
eukprot:3927954-Pyramimonas_sp.AAC.1